MRELKIKPDELAHRLNVEKQRIDDVFSSTQTRDAALLRRMSQELRLGPNFLSEVLDGTITTEPQRRKLNVVKQDSIAARLRQQQRDSDALAARKPQVARPKIMDMLGNLTDMANLILLEVREHRQEMRDHREEMHEHCRDMHIYREETRQRCAELAARTQEIETYMRLRRETA